MVEGPTLDFAERFCAGQVSDEEFLAELHTGSLLEPLQGWRAAPGGDALLFLLMQDLGTPAGRLNTLELLATLLRQHGRTPDGASLGAAATEFELLLKAQPAWVDVRGPIAKELLAATSHLAGKARVEALRTAIGARFRRAAKPPRWLQSPAWPLRDGEPCIFLGQHDITQYRHDTAAVYVFMVETTGQIVTVEQSA